MIINVLVCTPDGRQVIEEKEVADTWFSSVADEEATQETATPSETTPE